MVREVSLPFTTLLFSDVHISGCNILNFCDIVVGKKRNGVPSLYG